MKKVVNGEHIDMSPKEIKEFNEQQTKLSAKAARRQYKFKRQLAYPSIGEQLDLIYKAMVSGEMPVATEFVNKIKAIKDKYPKPEDK